MSDTELRCPCGAEAEIEVEEFDLFFCRTCYTALQRGEPIRVTVTKPDAEERPSTPMFPGVCMVYPQGACGHASCQVSTHADSQP